MNIYFFVGVFNGETLACGADSILFPAQCSNAKIELIPSSQERLHIFYYSHYQEMVRLEHPGRNAMLLGSLRTISGCFRIKMI
jgi:hypothetical protein